MTDFEKQMAFIMELDKIKKDNKTDLSVGWKPQGK